jgi:hypothetical protein
MKSFRSDPLSALVEAARTDLPNPAQLKALGVELSQSACASSAAGASLGGLFGSTAAAVKVVGIACTLGVVTVGVTHQEQVAELLSGSEVAPVVASHFPEGESSDRGSVQQIAPQKTEMQQAERVAPSVLQPELEPRDVGSPSRQRASNSTEKSAKSGPLAVVDFTRAPGKENQDLAKNPGFHLSEIQMIELAHQALPSDPARALALSQQHEQHFSHGRLSVERRVLTIKALFQLGRTEAARLALRSFGASYPDSVHLPHLRNLLASNADKIGTKEH